MKALKYKTILSSLLAITTTIAYSEITENVAILVEKGIFLQETKKEYKEAIDVYNRAQKIAETDGKLYEVLFRKAACSDALGN